jgi:dTDP-4-amino-4,6-dideoxygalactose transaminase
MMALNLQPGDEVIVPAFTYVATAEVIALMKLTPVLVDVNYGTFNIRIEEIEKAISPKTKAIVPVHLFGQCADMEKIMEIAKKHKLFVIEDTAQAIGADFLYLSDRSEQSDEFTTLKAGCIGDIGCTSFFPSKNLGCYGDGGAIYTNNDELAQKLKMIANHGQAKKYYHEVVGCNSRLDTIQAAILDVKLKYLDNYCEARQNAAGYYTYNLSDIQEIETPIISNFTTHVFHQYTLKIKNGKREELKSFLEKNGIPAMIYYPVPLNEQNAFKPMSKVVGNLENTYELCNSVLSLPIHTEMTTEIQDFIISKIKEFYKK